VNVVFTVYFGLAGLVLGSFINLAADRIPRGESLVSPGSHCRSCGRRLNIVDLVPVAGYLVRGGRCATCRTPIGVSAPVIEAVSAAIMLGPILAFGVWPGLVGSLAMVAAWGVAVTMLAARRAAQAQVEETISAG